jgi:hypothetical protein
MFDLIRQMFAGPKLSEESRDFIMNLATSRIWILAVGLRGTPSVARDTGPEAFKIIAAHRIDVSELGKGDSVFPFNYKQDGKQVLPFFSSEELARRFASDSGSSTDMSKVFQPRRLRAGFVAARENEDCELKLDPGSPTERTLSRGERLLLRSLSKAV